MTGRVGNKPVLKEINETTEVCEFTIYRPRRYKAKDKQRVSDKHIVEIISKKGGYATSIAENLTAGSIVEVVGEIYNNNYMVENVNVQGYKIRADHVIYWHLAKEKVVD